MNKNILIILTSGVLAAFITSIANIILTLLQMRNLKRLEKIKKQNDFLFDKFKVLNEQREKIVSISKTNFGSLLKALKDNNELIKYIKNSMEEYREKKKIYENKKYYLSRESQVEMDNLSDKIDNIEEEIKISIADAIKINKAQRKVPKELIDKNNEVIHLMWEFEKKILNTYDYELAKINQVLSSD